MSAGEGGVSGCKWKMWLSGAMMMKWREGVGRSASRRQLFGVLFSPLPQAKQHNPHITRVRTLTIDIARRAAPFISLLHAYHTHTTHTG